MCTQYGYVDLAAFQKCNDKFFFLKEGGTRNISQLGSKNAYGVDQGLPVVGPTPILSWDPFLKNLVGGVLMPTAESMFRSHCLGPQIITLTHVLIQFH